jgi:LysM domain
MKPSDFLTELSTEKLAQYKTAAAADASKADKEKDFARGNKRFSGIVKATKKQFANDAKKVSETHSARGVMITETRTYKLWENAGRKLVEAQLTPDQIQQIFKGAQNIETAGGTNRTLIGKGKDAATAVGQAWEDLKTKAQNSKPIAGFEQKYDAVAEKLKQATGGDQGAMKYVQYYRDFAANHPIAQGVIYAALIAALGISGAGAGGAAALGLLKMTDRLIQGDKFTSAAWSGAKTGALAYGASQLVQYFSHPNAPLPTDQIKSVKLPDGTDYVVQKGDTLSQIAQRHGVSVDDMMKANSGATTVTPSGQSMTWNDPNAMADVNPMGDAIPSGTGVQQDYTTTTAPKIGNPDVLKPGQHLNVPASAGPTQTYQGNTGLAGDTWDKVKSGKYPYSRISANQAAKYGLKESVNLTESQIYLLIGKIVNRQRKLDEGIWDSIKGQAGKAADWARTKGENLTTKITADKLLQAWKGAGSPTDSDQVAKVMIGAGVPQETVDNLMKNFVQGPSAGTNTNMWQGVDRSIPAVQRKAQAAQAAGAAPTAATAPSATTPTPSAAPVSATTPRPSASPVTATTATSATTSTPTPTGRVRVGAPAGRQAIDQAVAVVKTVRPERRTQVANYGKQQFDTLAQSLAKQPATTATDNTIAMPKPEKTNQKKTATAESMGLNYPETYEQTNNKFKGSGQRRIGTLTTEQDLAEEWSKKYKSSINCSHPKGFSQKAHCAGKKKHNEDVSEEKKPDFMKAGNMKPFKASGEEIPGAVHALEKLLLKAKEQGVKLNYTNIDKIMQSVCKKHNLTGDELHNEFVSKHHMIPDNWIVKQLDEACWKGYHKEGNKKMFGKTYPNCVKNEDVAEGSDELYQKAIRKYVQQVAHDYLGGGNAHLYGANKFDSEMFGVSQEQAKQDFKTLFPQALKQLQGVAEGLEQTPDQVQQTLNAWMEQDQQYEDPTKRAGFQAKVWPYIQKNIKTILADKGKKGNGDYPAAPYAAWLLVQHMDAYPQNQIEFYNALKQAIPNHPKIQFLRDRAAVNQWILQNANNPKYYYNSDPLPNPTVNVRNPAMFKDAGIVATSRKEALQNAINAGNKLLVAAVRATKAKTQPSFKQSVAEGQHSCPHCGGEMVSEELMNEKKDACYYKVKSRYKVWPSAYASGALVKCRKSHGNWGNGSKNESSILEGIERADENLHKWFKEKWVRFGPDGKIRGACARGDDSEGKPKCLPQSKAQNLGKKGRASAAARKRREDPNPERSGPAINVNTKKKSNESIDEGWFKNTLAGAALAGAALTGAGHAHAADLSQFGTTYLQQVASGEHPRPMVSIDDAKAELQAREQGKQQTVAPAAKPETSSGYSIDYLKKAADPDRIGRYLISVEKAQEMLNQATAPRARPALNIAPGDYPAAK